MPEISRFCGMVIKMYYENGEQHHKPHIHVYYGEYEAAIALDGEILIGDIPGKQYKILMQWIISHKSEIEKLWQCAINNEPLDKIEPYNKEDRKPDIIAEEIYYGADETGFTHIINAKPLENRFLLLLLSTGKKKLFDTNLLDGQVFEPLNDEEIFSKITLAHGAVTWKNGEIDCAPEYMYLYGYDYE